jgi:hypothetical protein
VHVLQPDPYTATHDADDEYADVEPRRDPRVDRTCHDHQRCRRDGTVSGHDGGQWVGDSDLDRHAASVDAGDAVDHALAPKPGNDEREPDRLHRSRSELYVHYHVDAAAHVYDPLRPQCAEWLLAGILRYVERRGWVEYRRRPLGGIQFDRFVCGDDKNVDVHAECHLRHRPDRTGRDVPVAVAEPVRFRKRVGFSESIAFGERVSFRQRIAVSNTDPESDAESDSVADAESDSVADAESDSVADAEPDSVADTIADAEPNSVADTIADAEPNSIADADARKRDPIEHRDLVPRNRQCEQPDIHR